MLTNTWQKLWASRFIHFVLIGVVNTCFGYGVFALLIYCKLHYSLAILLATCVGVLFNFKTIGHFVFKNNDHKRIFHFIAVYIVLYFINVGLVRVFYLIYPNYYLAGALSMMIVPLLSFWWNKRFVFARTPHEKTN